MLNVNDLERRYRRYKLKNIVPYIVIFLSLSIVLIVVLLVNNFDIGNSKTKNNQKIVEIQLKQTKEVTDKNETTLVEPKKQKTIKQESKTVQNLVLTPSLKFISSIKHSPSEVNYQRVVNKDKKEEKTKKDRILKPAKKEPKPVVIEEIELKSSNPVKIQRQNAQNDINHVIQRFEKNNNPALSLFIAKKYYEMKKYHQSYNYALITNRINDNIDASWIVFAKSLVKLDRKDEAIKTLKSYFDHSKSTQAKTLLEEIERGRFR